MSGLIKKEFQVLQNDKVMGRYNTEQEALGYIERIQPLLTTKGKFPKWAVKILIQLVV